jgi:hypothetical protein
MGPASSPPPYKSITAISDHHMAHVAGAWLHRQVYNGSASTTYAAVPVFRYSNRPISLFLNSFGTPYASPLHITNTSGATSSAHQRPAPRIIIFITRQLASFVRSQRIDEMAVSSIKFPTQLLVPLIFRHLPPSQRIIL